MEPKAPRTELEQAEVSHIQLAEKQHAEDRALNQGKECPSQATPAALSTLSTVTPLCDLPM
jgi:hypothetical protein